MATLTPDQKVTFLRIIEAERARNRVMAYEAQNTLPYFKALGMDLEKARVAARDSLPYETCIANHLAQGRRLVTSPTKPREF